MASFTATLMREGTATKTSEQISVQLDRIDGIDSVTGGAITVYGPGVGGAYALATNLNAAGTTYTQALIASIPGHIARPAAPASAAGPEISSEGTASR